MDRLRFDFKMKGSADGKSTILCLISIGTPEGQNFGMPEEYQPTNLHKALITSQVFAKVKKTLTKRNQYRKVWISLTKELAEVYLDEEKNLQFQDFYLEETTEKEVVESATNETIKQLLEKVFEDKQKKSEVQNLGKIARDFMIDKFDGKNSNAYQWLQEFEKECERCMITEDRKIIEILRFFLEKASSDWYSCMILKFTVESEWSRWKENFRETFANGGWSPVRHAFAFKYQAGSFLDYALKKEKLLLEIRKSMDTETLIDLIVVGLPNYVSDKIDRGTLEETKDLYNEINKLEHLVTRNKMDRREKYSDKKFLKGEEKKPCGICEKEKKGKRYHPEATCWFREKNDKNQKAETIKSVNNSELEIELNETNQKN